MEPLLCHALPQVQHSSGAHHPLMRQIHTAFTEAGHSAGVDRQEA